MFSFTFYETIISLLTQLENRLNIKCQVGMQSVSFLYFLVKQRYVGFAKLLIDLSKDGKGNFIFKNLWYLPSLEGLEDL